MATKRDRTNVLVKKSVVDTYNVIYSIEGRSLAEVFQNKIEIDLIRRCLQPGLILDGGCGRGRILYGLVNDVDKVIGLDFSRVGIVRANRDFKLHRLDRFGFVVGDMEKLPFRDGVFSTVLCVGTLEYALPSMVQYVFSESSRVLKEGGMFCFNFWNATCPYRLFWKLLSKLFGRTRSLRRSVRLSFWSFWEIHEALRKTGLNPNSVNAYFLIVPWIVNFIRYMPLTFLLKIKKQCQSGS